MSDTREEKLVASCEAYAAACERHRRALAELSTARSMEESTRAAAYKALEPLGDFVGANVTRQVVALRERKKIVIIDHRTGSNPEVWVEDYIE